MHRKGFRALVAICCCQSGNAEASVQFVFVSVPSAEALPCELEALMR